MSGKVRLAATGPLGSRDLLLGVIRVKGVGRVHVFLTHFSTLGGNQLKSVPRHLDNRGP